MKTVKKLLALFLAVCLIGGLAAVHIIASAEEPFISFDNGRFEYMYDRQSATLIVRGEGKLPAFDEAHPVPWAAYRNTVRRLIVVSGVTGLSEGAFADCPKLKSVVFPTSLDYIDTKAFTGSNAIETIEYPGNMDDLKAIIDENQVRELMLSEGKTVETTSVNREVTRLVNANTRRTIWQPTYDDTDAYIAPNYAIYSRTVTETKTTENKDGTTTVTTTEKDSDGNTITTATTTKVDAEGEVVGYTETVEVKDSQGNTSVQTTDVTITENADGTTTVMERVKDEKGNLISSSATVYDKDGLPTLTVDAKADGTEKTTTHYENGLPVSGETEGAGYTAKNTYDAAGNLVKTDRTYADGSTDTTTYAVDVNGNDVATTTSKDEDGNTVTQRTTTNEAGRVLSDATTVADKDGKILESSSLTSTKYPDGSEVISNSTVDEKGSVNGRTETLNAKGQTTQIVDSYRDSNSSWTSTTTNTAFDENDRPIAYTEQSTQTGKDGTSTRLSVRNADGSGQANGSWVGTNGSSSTWEKAVKADGSGVETSSWKNPNGSSGSSKTTTAADQSSETVETWTNPDGGTGTRTVKLDAQGNGTGTSTYSATTQGGSFKNSTEQTYENGLLVKTVTETQSSGVSNPVQTRTYSYDESGRQVGYTETMDFPDGTTRKTDTTCVYDETGRLTETVTVGDDPRGQFESEVTTVTKYDENGYIASEITTAENEALFKREMLYQNGRPVKETTTSSLRFHGMTATEEWTDYDQNGGPTVGKRTVYDADGKVLSTTDTTQSFDAQGRYIGGTSTSRDQDGKIVETSQNTTTYTSTGTISTHSSTSDTSSYTSTSVYENGKEVSSTWEQTEKETGYVSRGSSSVDANGNESWENSGTNEYGTYSNTHTVDGNGTVTETSQNSDGKGNEYSSTSVRDKDGAGKETRTDNYVDESGNKTTSTTETVFKADGTAVSTTTWTDSDGNTSTGDPWEWTWKGEGENTEGAGLMAASAMDEETADPDETDETEEADEAEGAGEPEDTENPEDSEDPAAPGEPADPEEIEDATDESDIVTDVDDDDDDKDDDDDDDEDDDEEEEEEIDSDAAGSAASAGNENPVVTAQENGNIAA